MSKIRISIFDTKELILRMLFLLNKTILFQFKLSTKKLINIRKTLTSTKKIRQE